MPCRFGFRVYPENDDSFFLYQKERCHFTVSECDGHACIYFTFHHRLCFFISQSDLNCSPFFRQKLEKIEVCKYIARFVPVACDKHVFSGIEWYVLLHFINADIFTEFQCPVPSVFKPGKGKVYMVFRLRVRFIRCECDMAFHSRGSYSISEPHICPFPCHEILRSACTVLKAGRKTIGSAEGNKEYAA